MLSALVLLFTFMTCTVSAGVAPGDEKPVCSTLRAQGAAPTPAYSANMRVLMDSWNYQNLLPARTGAVWDQVDYDVNNNAGLVTKWIQQSNTPCQQTVQVCGFRAGRQDNWLITQLINRTVNGTRLSQVRVTIEFELHNCDSSSNCQRTFNTHIYETSTENATGARDIANYRQIDRISPDITTGARVNKTIDIKFYTNYSSFYFATQDETTCIVVTRLIVFYTVCLAQTDNLIHYPETIVPPSTSHYENVSNFSVSASCIENAEPENGLAPVVTCSADGVWVDSAPRPGVGCQCKRGYFRERVLVDDSEMCEPCPAGTYLSPSNNSCSTCPANSVSEEEGLAQCTCIEGYYRAPGQGEEDLPCTSAESSTFGEINSTKSNRPLLENVTVLLVTTLPLVLVCVVLSTTLVSFAVLRCIRAKKRDYHNPTTKSNYYDNRPEVTEINEPYYTTVRSNHDDKPEVTKEIEETYYYTTMKSICDDKPEVAKETEEAYYTTVGSKHDDKPEATKEIEEAYYTTMKSICDDGSREIGKDQGVYYNTIDISTCAVDPQTLDMERN